MKRILADIRERVVKNWQSTLLGVASTGLVAAIHFKFLTLNEALELLGMYHAIRLAFKKEAEQQ